MTTRLIAVAVVCLAGLSPAASFVQQRDATPAAVATGTAEIRGVVVSDEVAPQPIRRAIVTVTGGEGAVSRSVLTDDNGRFAFLHLPAGRFFVGVKKAAYLAAAYGAMKPGRQGSELALAPAQHAAISITMARGAAISGTLRDEAGAPLAGVSLSAIDLHPPGGLDLSPSADQAITDDRGVYRFFGLMPGEYVIAATPPLSASGSIGSRSAPDMDAVLAELSKRHPNGTTIATAPSASAPLLPTPAPVGFAPVYYPGGATFADAGRIRVGTGEERAGLDFAMIPVPVASISGNVTGDVASLAAVQLSLITSGPRALSMGIGGIFGQPPDAEGKFKYGNLTPGPIRIVARARRGAPDPGAGGAGRGGFTVTLNSAGAGRGADPANSAADEILFGVLDVDLRGQDQTGLSITLQPGGTLSGRIAFDAIRSAPVDFSKWTVTMQQPGGAFSSSNGTVTIGTSLGSVAAASVRADGTFEITGIGPAAYKLSCFLPPDVSAVWRLRSALAAGRDLLDIPLEFLPGQAVRDVVLTLSDKRTEINGSLQTSTGQPATPYFVVAFPADRSLWKSGARRMKSTRPASDGRFVFSDLPAGTYLIAALTDLDPNDWQDPAFLEQVAPAGVTVVLREGERKTQDLKIVG